MSKFTGSPSVFSSNPFRLDETTPSHALGELMYAPDGRKFRYVYAGASALVAGQLQQAPAEDTGDQNIAPTAASVGALSITTSDTMTVTANQYAGGWMTVTVTPGVGIMYKIKQHAAATAAAATFELEDEIQVALTTTSRLDFVPNPYNGVVVAPTTLTSAVVGIAVNDLTLNQYGWIQSGGPGVIRNDAAGALTVGVAVMPSTSVAGSVRLQTAGNVIVGQVLTGVASGEYGTARLLLD